MKKYFVTGLIILLPLAVTLAVAMFVFNLLTEPLAGALARILDHYDLLEKDFFFASGAQIQFFVSQILILGFLFCFTALLGMIARYFFVNYLISLWNRLIHKIPLVRTIYKSTQDVINTLFTSKASSFKQVVLAPFPSPGVYSIGLVTQDDLQGLNLQDTNPKMAVFIPTTPNPTSGFLMIYPRSDLIFLNMKVEEAFKYVLSCGVIATNFDVVSYEETK